MRKIKLQKSQIRFLNSIIEEAVKAFRDWVDEGLDIPEQLCSREFGIETK